MDTTALDATTASAVAAEPPRDPLAALWSPVTARARCAAILAAVEDGRSPWFTLDLARLPELAARAASSIRRHGPTPQPVGGSLWHAFGAGGVDRLAAIEQRLASRDAPAQARALADLAVVAVLLDTDAASGWRYDESADRPTDALAMPAQRQRRDDLLAMLDRASGATRAAADDSTAPASSAVASATPAADGEPARPLVGAAALAVAVLRAFADGAFSGDATDTLRVDARALQQLDATALRALLPGGTPASLPALEARAEMLRRLGTLLDEAARRDGGAARPARELDRWLAAGGAVDASDLLRHLASRWAPIWFDGARVLGLPSGDVWPHRWAGAGAAWPAAADASSGPAASDDRTTAGSVPLHLPAQRLVHALVEPLRRAGVRVSGLQALTALSDAALGRTLLGAGIVVPRDARDLGRSWTAAHERTVELRALGIALGDELARQVRAQLDAPDHDLPLPTLLAACAAVAAEAGSASSTLRIDGHGTVL